MTIIKVNATEFERIAAKFDTAASNCTKIHAKIKSATDNLTTNWQGNSKTSFKKEFNTLYKNMDSYKVVLEGISKDIKEVALRFKETDESLKSIINK